jgi:hypothetical protein
MKKTVHTQEQVIDHLTVIGRDRVKLKSELKTNGTDMNDTICLGFELGVTAAKMVEALGTDPDTGRPVVGPARVFQIRDGK